MCWYLVGEFCLVGLLCLDVVLVVVLVVVIEVFFVLLVNLFFMVVLVIVFKRFVVFIFWEFFGCVVFWVELWVGVCWFWIGGGGGVGVEGFLVRFLIFILLNVREMLFLGEILILVLRYLIVLFWLIKFKIVLLVFLMRICGGYLVFFGSLRGFKWMSVFRIWLWESVLWNLVLKFLFVNV